MEEKEKTIESAINHIKTIFALEDAVISLSNETSIRKHLEHIYEQGKLDGKIETTQFYLKNSKK